LFLDEIGELTLTHQVKLLRFLESKTFMRLGGKSKITVKNRVIAATNKNLRAAVTQRQFREDLFQRLNVLEIQLPPLRLHIEDIPLLTKHFIRKYNIENGCNIDPNLNKDVLDVLMQRHWEDGNVRELNNALERAIIFSNGDTLEIGNLPPVDEPRGLDSGQEVVVMGSRITIRELKKKHVLAVCTKYKNIKIAAGVLGTSRPNLHKILSDWGYDSSFFRRS
jgi:DNA-binding NtrC family response regulator